MNSLNLLFLHWQNLNVLEWNVELREVTLAQGAEFVDLDADIVTVLDGATLRRDGVDTVLVSNDRVAYEGISDKDEQGRPDRYWQYRRAGHPVRLYIWQTSERTTDVLRLWCITRTDDVTAPTETLDIVDRWLEATTAALAVKLWEKTPIDMITRMSAGLYQTKQISLMNSASEALYFAQTEDRDKADINITPYNPVDDL